MTPATPLTPSQIRNQIGRAYWLLVLLGWFVPQEWTGDTAVYVAGGNIITDAELAERLEVSQRTISNWRQIARGWRRSCASWPAAWSATDGPAPRSRRFSFQCWSAVMVAKKETRGNLGGDTTASLKRHKGQCSICSHEKRKEIEAAFVAWESPEKIAAEYGLTHRSTVYRHAKAFGLNVKRQQNIRVPLERIIEGAGDPTLQVTGATVVQAIAVYGKLNAQGQLIERRETLNLNELFERMTVEEKEAYARDGKLPDWFTQTVSSQVATGPNESEEDTDAE